MRLWIGIALLAGSWLLGLDYFYPANGFTWFIALAGGLALLTTAVRGRDGQGIELLAERTEVVGHWRVEAMALVLLLPAVWFAAWPYRAAPLLIVLGLALRLMPLRKRWAEMLVQGAVAAGIVLLVQALALEVYACGTMRSHDLPWPLPDILAGLLGLLGIDAVADGSSVVMHSMRQVHRLAATWELLVDPATYLFFVGGVTMLALRAFFAANSESETVVDAATDSVMIDLDGGSRWQAWIRAVRVFTLVIIAWLPLRAMLLVGLYLHRVLRSDPDRPLHAMNHFFTPWALLLLLGPAVLLAWWFVRQPRETKGAINADGKATNTELAVDPSPEIAASSHRSAGILRPYASITLVALSVALFTVAVYWNPVGGRKDGRVMVVERHSKWEPTTKPYDTKWYVEPRLFDEGSGYNYARIYRYLGQYFEMSRLLENDKIDDATLANCDVLVIKTPTERYRPEEVKAISRFVEQGGGLLLIGEHTNFMGSSTFMNDLVRPMGFIFRDDLLFGFGESPYDQLYHVPPVPHPAVQGLPPTDFAVSCSIDPGFSSGRAVIASTGLWSMRPDYHFENYHPIPQHCPEMRYGAFVQAWAAWQGKGRVMAFSDSTIFSNFCIGQPGKSELMLGMVEWLNHRSPWLDPRPWLVLLGVVTLTAAFWKGRNLGRMWLLLIAAGCFGWVLASLAVTGLQRWSMPAPERRRPQQQVVIDRAFSSVPLSKGAYPQGKDKGYGLLEQWIARLDCCTVRKEDDEILSGDVLVTICPSRSVPAEIRERLEQFVANGGKLVMIDSPENTNSTANSLLWPFGISMHHDRIWKGKLTTGLKSPAVDIEAACELIGGQPVARLGEHAVAVATRHGKGAVLAVGFGSVWNDIRMGETWTLEPDATTKARYDVLFGILQPFFEGKPLPPLPKVKTPKSDEKDSLLKESGPAEL